MYIPPKHSSQLTQPKDSIIFSTFTTIKNLPNTIITADVNAHLPLWYLPIEDHKGELIEDILLADYPLLHTRSITYTRLEDQCDGANLQGKRRCDELQSI